VETRTTHVDLQRLNGQERAAPGSRFSTAFGDALRVLDGLGEAGKSRRDTTGEVGFPTERELNHNWR
jgi:hypothetical protein